MSRDTFEMFQEQDRGRFGDNEAQDRRGESARVTGASDLIDLTLILREDRPASIAVNRTDKPRDKWIFLPKSQVEFAHASGGNVEVTLPRWLAKDKGLI